MANESLVWTLWNNGQHDKSGNGYGLKIPIADRDRYFDPSQGFAVLNLPGVREEIRVTTKKKSFWTDTCRELISKELGVWLIRNGLAPSRSGSPPKLRVTSLGNGRFRIQGRADE